MVEQQGGNHQGPVVTVRCKGEKEGLRLTDERWKQRKRPSLLKPVLCNTQGLAMANSHSTQEIRISQLYHQLKKERCQMSKINYWC